ncbi:benzoate 4-monooxygenase cytochrome P450 [Zopfia rhizophila CBS 207.26]|uniref:Benzoate 4-monooxygenase cytochrome P450 n=1 Tax=Zopfia rhizophila CBS 207.26 TaxID=1314779 RepID=A0A6A6E8R6_9PEZI|nr:benzoate 4-monooxygenase cytochrome P450 [Zopfia rhizophila CBS 207.26]
MPSLSKLVAVGLLVAVFLHRLYRIIYLLYLSPLRSFPGPKLWACSRLPLQFSMLRGRVHKDFMNLHKQYGPVARVSPNQLAFFTAQSFQDIYNRTGSRNFKKDRTYYESPPNGVDHLVCAVDDAVHLRHRKLLAWGFSGEGLRTQESLVMRHVDAFIQGLDKETPRGKVDICAWFTYTTFDITGDLMFGEPFGCLQESRLHPWIQLTFNAIKALVFIGAAKQFPAFYAVLMRIIPKSILQKGIDHFNLSAEKVDKRLGMGTARPDFMSAMLKNGLSEKDGHYQENEKIMSRAELHSNAYILIIAGSETSATALSGITYYLCKHPIVLQRLLTEIRTCFSADADINFNSTAQLSYLNAVIEEGLRVYPPLVTGLCRLPPPGGDIVDGHFVPEGTTVATHCYVTFHSPSNFNLPEEFIPERWLGTDKRFANDKREALQPFSLGPRGCLGKNLAYAEIRLMLSKLLYHFDIELRPESATWTDQDVYYLWAKPPLMVNLTKRVDAF